LFRALGARGPALTWVLVAWVLVAGQVDQPEYHDVHRGEVVAAPETPVSVESQLDEFVARDDERPVRPMLVVSASGGGIRAAYWTAAVLTCVIERETVAEHDEPIDPCGAPATVDDAAARADGLFVMSGISGGSLGLVAYDAHLEAGFGEDERVAGGDWYDEPLGADFLSPTISRWLFGDLPNVMIGRTGGVDRARALERAWENAWVDAEHPLSGGFLESQLDGGPLLLLNSFSIEDGCRLNVSILSTSGGRGLDQCAQMYGDGTTSMDATTDYLGFAACAAGDEGWQDLPRSTAALLSARFPYVTPSGRLACEEDPDILATYAGDGGYRDTSAASPVLELWPEVDEYVTKHNQVADNGCLVPFFLQIDNGYSQAQGRSVDPQPSELTVPIVGYQHASGGIANAARIAAARRFSGTIVDRAGTEVVADPSVLVPTPVPRFMQLTTQSHPGTKAPLGWVLSEAAQRDLDEQLSALGRDIEQVRAWLDGETLHGGVGRGWTDVGLPPPPSGGEQVSLECVRPGD
jgi:hypothetical protein